MLGNVDAAHSYSITAVYLDGSESDPVTVQVINNIETIGRNETVAYNVYTLNGILVRKQSESLAIYARAFTLSMVANTL